MAQISVRSLGRSSAFVAAMQLWQIGSRFILTPIILARLGLAGYGTWTLLFSICSYVSMFDTSFGFAYAKFTAEYDQKKDYFTLSKIIGSGIALVSSFGLAALSVIWLARMPLLTALKVPAPLLHDAGWALLIVAFCLLMRMGVGSVYQILAGLQRMDLQYKLMMMSSALEFVVVLVLLHRGMGLLALAFGHLTGQVAGVIGGRFWCWRLCPALVISPTRISREGLRKVLSLGGRFQVLSFLNVMIEQTMKMLISALCGISFLALFDLADKLLGLGKTASGALLAPLMPAFASLHAGEDKDRWATLYMQVSKIVAAVTVVSLGFLFIVADRLLVLWTKHDYPLAAWTIRAMCISHSLVLLTGVGTASLRGKGTLGLEIRYTLVGTSAIVALLVPAAWWGDYRAMILSVVIGQLISASWFLVAFSRREGVSFLAYCRQIVLRPGLIGAAAVAAGLLWRQYSPPIDLPTWPPRWQAVLQIAVALPLYVTAAGTALWYGSFTPQERRTLKERLLGERDQTIAAPPRPERPSHTRTSKEFA